VLSSKTYKKYFALVLLGIFVQSCAMSTMALLVYVLYGNIANFIVGFTLIFAVVNLKGAFEIAFIAPNMVLMYKTSKHTPYFLDLPFIIISSIMMIFITPQTNVWVFITAMCFLGIGISCIRPVPLSLLPDLTDIYEAMYGRRAEGINAGLNTLGRKVVEGLTIALLGFIFGLFGLNAQDLTFFNPESVSSGALTALKIVYGVLPIIACSFMLVLTFVYRLDGKRHNMVKALIKEKRENGFAVVTDEQKTELEKLTGKRFTDLWISKTEQKSTEDIENGCCEKA